MENIHFCIVSTKLFQQTRRLKRMKHQIGVAVGIGMRKCLQKPWEWNKVHVCWKIQCGPPWLRLWTQHTQHTYLLTHKWLELIRIVGEKILFMENSHTHAILLFLKSKRVRSTKDGKSNWNMFVEWKLSFRTNCNLNGSVGAIEWLHNKTVCYNGNKSEFITLCSRIQWETVT